MHSVRLEPTKLILIGTRTTYQATGDAGLLVDINSGTEVPRIYPLFMCIRYKCTYIYILNITRYFILVLPLPSDNVQHDLQH